MVVACRGSAAAEMEVVDHEREIAVDPGSLKKGHRMGENRQVGSEDSE
jgi:hypothetical protein